VIAPEGKLPVAAMVLAALVLGWRYGAPPALPALVAAGLLAVLFREFPRAIVGRALAVLSPVDGCLQDAEEVEEGWLGRASLRIRIRPQLPGVAALRSPVEGKVMEYWTCAEPAQRGRAQPARGSPTCYTLWVRTDENDDVVFSVRAAPLISRFRLDVSPGERIGHGKRLGFVYFGRTVEVFVDARSRPEAQPGARLLAGSDVIATLVH